MFRKLRANGDNGESSLDDRSWNERTQKEEHISLVVWPLKWDWLPDMYKKVYKELGERERHSVCSKRKVNGENSDIIDYIEDKDIRVSKELIAGRDRHSKPSQSDMARRIMELDRKTWCETARSLNRQLGWPSDYAL